MRSARIHRFTSLIVALVVLLGCRSNTVSSPPEEDTADASDSTSNSLPKQEAHQGVELINHGNAPHRQLRYQFLDGSFHQWEGAIIVTAQQQQNGPRLPEGELRFEGFVKNIDVDATGVTRRRAITRLDFIQNGANHPQSMLPPTGVLLFTEQVTSTGQRLHFENLDVKKLESKEVLQQLEGSLLSPYLLLPQEEVGVGAEWNYSTKGIFNGIQFDSRTNVRLKALEGDKALLEYTLTQTSPTQAWKGALLPIGTEVKILGQTGDSQGTQSVDLVTLEVAQEQKSATSISIQVSRDREDVQLVKNNGSLQIRLSERLNPLVASERDFWISRLRELSLLKTPAESRVHLEQIGEHARYDVQYSLKEGDEFEFKADQGVAPSEGANDEHCSPLFRQVSLHGRTSALGVINGQSTEKLVIQSASPSSGSFPIADYANFPSKLARLGELEGLELLYQSDHRGNSVQLWIDESSQANTVQFEVLNEVLDAFVDLQVPLPKDTLGLGAMWTSKSDGQTAGLKVRRAKRNTITSLTADSMAIQLTLDEVVPAQRLENTNLPPNTQIRILSGHATGEGTAFINFQKPWSQRSEKLTMSVLLRITADQVPPRLVTCDLRLARHYRFATQLN